MDGGYELRARCVDDSVVTVAFSPTVQYTQHDGNNSNKATSMRYPEDFYYLNGNDACKSKIGENNNTYYSTVNLDKRPSLGVFNLKEQNKSNDFFKSPKKKFQQTDLINFLNNGVNLSGESFFF